MTKSKNYKKPSSGYKQPVKLARFYRSDDWHLARAIKICSANGLCEKCGAPGKEVHHIIRLTINNVDNPSISLNQDNLILLCNDCHNKEHHRFGKKKVYKFDKDGNLVDYHD